MNAEKLLLRVFAIPEDIELRLSNRASGVGVAKADLARQYVDEMIVSGIVPDISETKAPLVMRSYYLTVTQDAALTALAAADNKTKGQLFRAALIRGMGI